MDAKFSEFTRTLGEIDFGEFELLQCYYVVSNKIFLAK